MELQYIVLTIIKILISVPTLVVVIQIQEINGAALIGGYVNNGNAPSKANISEFKIDLSEDNIQEESAPVATIEKVSTHDETVPDPEPLIVPGYNLPENIFNKGKPFYLEKDPLTGNIDFNSRSKLYEEYDYEDVEYDKSEINRKDGPESHVGTGGHKPSDINQLTPNFHDFLNLPVKYNPDKYVYPLISSSYANTKVQGNVNKHQNHKNYVVTTYKPTLSPTYFTTKYYNTQDKVIKYTTPKKSYEDVQFTTATPPKVYTTKKIENLMNSPMNHPSYSEDYYKQPATSSFSTKLTSTSTTTTSTTPASTKRPMSLFEQLFGSDYEDNEMTDASITTTETLITEVPLKSSKPHPVTLSGQQIKLFHNLPKKATTPGYQSTYYNVLTGSHMSNMHINYDYEEEKPAQVSEVSKRPVEISSSMTHEPYIPYTAQITEDYDYDYLDKTSSTTTTFPTTTSTQKTTPQIVVVQTTSTTNEPSTNHQVINDDEEAFITTTTDRTKMTSLPLGENHIHLVHHTNRPIIVASQNLREQLNDEKVGYVHPQAPSTSSIHIAPDQDTVSFVMGNHQNVEGAGGNQGGYVGTSLKESPYESNPFRPVYDQQPDKYQIKNEYQRPYNLNKHQPVGSSATIQPMKNGEASLSIGNQIVLKPGHVMDEKIEDMEYSHGSKIVFPDAVNKSTTLIPDLSPPPPPKQPIATPSFNLHPNQHPSSLPSNLPSVAQKEVLKLNSKPMFHQLPSELTPPESVGKLPQRVRPPWDPRPGHFHAGRPEYARPPRPQEVYKRVDTLPNILPQFRPNMGSKPPPPHQHHHPFVPHGQHPYFERQPHPHPPAHLPSQSVNLQHKHMPQQHHASLLHSPHGQQNYARQPLLERPSNNRPIGFFEKLHSPPVSGNSQSKIPSKVAEDRIGPKPAHGHQGPPSSQVPQQAQNLSPMQEHFAFLQSPPKIVVPNRRNGEDPETLQMLQAKLEKKSDKPIFKQKLDIKENLIKDTNKDVVTSKLQGSTDKPLYVVYPVNSAPIKLDAVDNNKKETVVIGTRAELPLPPSKIKLNPPSSIATEADFKYEVKDRHDFPILKPRPATYPIISDFPYPLERPNPSMLPYENKLPDELTIISSNQWNTIEDSEPRIVNHNTPQSANSNQISVTLKTYTEKPIAVAYTPTESNKQQFSMPNYASLVIPEIRDSEITVSAVMHHGQPSPAVVHHRPIVKPQPDITHSEEPNSPRPQAEFQAPFQASAHMDHSMSQGWAVVREKDERKDEITTMPAQTTSEFDIENFKPQLEGGFKPIYSYAEETKAGKESARDAVINERQE